MKSRRLPRALLLAATLGVSLHARAQEATPAKDPVYPAEVGLLQQPCQAPLYDASALATALRVELASLGVRSVVTLSAAAALTPASATLALVQVRCDEAAQSVVIELADLATGHKVERELLLSDVEQSARPRALSMAVVVLMESAWTTAALDAQAAPGALPEAVVVALRRRLRTALDAKVTPSVAPAAPVVESMDARTSVNMALLTRTFPAHGTALLGAELGIDPSLGTRVRLPLRVEALLGSQGLSDQKGPIATMNLYWFTGGAGIEWHSATSPELSLGPYARVGYALAHAKVSRAGYTGKSVSGLVAVVGASATLRAPLSHKLDAQLGLDLGYAPVGVVFLADLSRSAGMAAVTLAARVGLALRL